MCSNLASANPQESVHPSFWSTVSLVVFATYEAVLALRSCCQDSVVALVVITF